MQTISLKLPESLLALLESESLRRRINKSQLVRTAIERELSVSEADGEGSCFDLAKDLAGSVKGLRRDLATNPKHMEGFGR